MIPLSVLGRINDLKRLPRTGWLLAGIRAPESVADHTCATALLAVFLAQTVNAELEATMLSEPLDLGKIVNLALVHDFAECVLTDLPRRSTEVFTKQVKHAAEAQVMQEILAGVPNGEETIALWQEYREAITPEAHLVHDADKLELVYQAFCYEQQGQRNLDDYWEDHYWHYRASAALFQQIVAQRKNGHVEG